MSFPDAHSAARTLSLSPDHSPSLSASSPPLSPDPPPPWARRDNSRSSRRLSSARLSRTHQPPALTRFLRASSKASSNLLRLYLSLPLVQRVAVAIALLVLNTLLILFLAYSEAIFAWLAPISHKWRALPAGWLIVWAMTFLTAFPPIIGYGTSVTIAGFVYGFPLGYPIVATATVAGSLTAFYTSRTIFSGYVHRLVGRDHRFIALGQVLRKDGLGMLTAVRLCPLPYSISNGFLATIPSIRPVPFAVATAMASPKLLVFVFIGSRLALIAENGGEMSTANKALNYASMALGALLGAVVGWLIYHRTMARAAELALEAAAETHSDADGSHPRHVHSQGGEDGYGTVRGNADFDYADVEAGLVDPDDVAALMSEDDISLWANDGVEAERYRDQDEEQEGRGDQREEDGNDADGDANARRAK